MFVKYKLLLLTVSLYVLLSFCCFLSAEDKYFSLNERWSFELEPHVWNIGITAIKLYDLNDNRCQEIIIGTRTYDYPSHGLLSIASDSARGVIASSPELPYGISCIEVGDLDQNGIPEILAGTRVGDLWVFLDAELDTYITAPETSISAVVSLKAVSNEESTLVYVATSDYQLFYDLGRIYLGTGVPHDLQEIHSSMAVPEQVAFADLDLDQQGELIWGDFYWFHMTRVIGASAHICIRGELPDDTIGCVTTLFDFNPYWGVGDGGFTSLHIGNCDDDSSLEILGSAFVDTCSPAAGDTCCLTVLSAVDGSTEEEQWELTYYDTVNIIKGIALVDFNEDGINEVLVAHKKAPMELLDGGDGSKIAESDSSYKVDHFAFGDVDGDGEEEIVIADGNILRVLELDFSTDVPEKKENLFGPHFIALGQNYPNPFNSCTTIPFALKSPAHTTLAVYNILGQKVRTLLNARRLAGNHKVVWNGENDEGETVPSGIYFYKLSSEKYSESKKMLFLK